MPEAPLIHIDRGWWPEAPLIPNDSLEDDGLAEAPLVHNMIEDGGLMPHSYIMIEDGGLRPHSYIMIEDGGLRPHTYTMIENDGLRPHISPTQYDEEWWSEAFT